MLVLVTASKGVVLCNNLDIKYVGSLMYSNEQTLIQLLQGTSEYKKPCIVVPEEGFPGS
jgi:hypothetical protein